MGGDQAPVAVPRRRTSDLASQPSEPHRLIPVFSLSILPSAQGDLESGYWFYEAQGDGLGTYFLDCLTGDIESLRFFAGLHPQPIGGFHRTLSKRFPFAIYYELSGGMAVIVAVLDCRQNPASIRSRLAL